MQKQLVPQKKNHSRKYKKKMKQTKNYFLKMYSMHWYGLHINKTKQKIYTKFALRRDKKN